MLKKARLSIASSPAEVYKSYLKNKYLERKMVDDGKWPLLPAKKYINLAVIGREQLNPGMSVDTSKALLYGDISDIKQRSGIKLRDIAVPDEDGVLPKFVLVEGAPGVGKSTFAWEACRKWAEGEILKDFELVILVKLRDDSIRKATCLGDLIQYPRDLTIQQTVIDEITKSGGKGVLLLLEGYDELPAPLREKDSLFREVIKGTGQFQEGTILVTSRHWASQPFLLPHSTSRRVSQHIEILGFTERDISDYLKCTLENCPDLLHNIEQYLQLHPHIHSMMYIPLNCAIIVEVYRYNKERNSIIPKTMTELYSSLVRSLLLRHICELPEYRDKCVTLEDFSNLPTCIENHFRKMCKVAYRGIFQKTQKIIFSADDIPSDLDTLGLMQSSMELHVDVGAKKSFNFLHLTIQEFLAACHITLFSLHDQTKFFAHYEDTMVIRFLAGLSPPSLESSLVDTSSSSVLKLKIEDIHRLFEAKLKPPQGYVVGDPREPIVNPFSSYVLGHLIANSKCHWDVFIGGKKEIGTIQMFVHGILDKGEGSFESELTLHVKIENYVHCDVEKLFNVPIAIEQLELKPYFEDRSSSEAAFLHPFAAGGDSEAGIKHLCLSKLKFSHVEAEKLKHFLSSTESVVILSLAYCRFNSKSIITVFQGVNLCKSIRRLNLFLSPHYEHHCDIIFETLRINRLLGAGRFNLN